MVGITEVLDLQHPGGEDRGQSEWDYEEHHGISRYLLTELTEQGLETIVQETVNTEHFHLLDDFL